MRLTIAQPFPRGKRSQASTRRKSPNGGERRPVLRCRWAQKGSQVIRLEAVFWVQTNDVGDQHPCDPVFIRLSFVGDDGDC